MRRSPGAIVLVAALAITTGACRDDGDGSREAGSTTTSSGPSQSLTSATEDTQPVAETDVVEVDLVLRRLDTELDRLERDLATGEGETQQVRLESAKAVAGNAITRRLLALQNLTTFVPALSQVAEADRKALSDQLQSQIDGLTGLQAKIQGAADPAAVRTLAARIVSDYRVYVLTIPRTRGILVADIELAAADRLTRLADRLTASADQAEAKGKDIADARVGLEALRTQITAVTGPVTPLPAALLGLEPGGYPANRAVIEEGRQTLRTGRVGLGDAVRLTREVLTDLK